VSSSGGWDPFDLAVGVDGGGPAAVVDHGDRQHVTVLDGAVMGRRSLVGAHALVVGGTKISDEVFVTGSPAKVGGPIAGTGAEMWVNVNPGAYQDLARRYQASFEAVPDSSVLPDA
jgi:hypothetical protein